MIGFQQLPSNIVELLICFDEYDELVLPELFPNGVSLLNTLIKKDLVKKSTPFKLTKKGKRMVLYYKNSQEQ